MIYFDANTNSWGEKQHGKFVSLHTPEEFRFREEALKDMLSGKLSQREIDELQADLVRRRQLSIYSQANKDCL